MILVTLGTHPMPMDRLLQELDRLVIEAVLVEEVIVQTPSVRWRPQRLSLRSIVPYDDLLTLVRQARVVISHAGPGNLAVIRAAGKVPIVVPRDADADEHVDNHQQEYAARIKGEAGYIVVESMDELAGAIAIAPTRAFGDHREGARAAAAKVSAIIECCRS